MEGKRCIQGRWLDETEIGNLAGWIESRPGWSRKRLAKGLCEWWDWRDHRGRLKDFAARSLLLKLEAEGGVKLPALQEHQRRAARKIEPLAQWKEPSAQRMELAELRPLRVSIVQSGTAQWRRWAFYLDRYHYLGLRVVGENIGYLIEDGQNRDVACLLFGAAAWKCSVRDEALGWKNGQRVEQLSRVANNSRFLILPWVRVKCLASHVLGLVSRRIKADWQQKYGHGLDWLETFVEVGRFEGSCYAAANWRVVGQTQGRGRQDREHECSVARKKVFVYRLNG